MVKSRQEAQHRMSESLNCLEDVVCPFETACVNNDSVRITPTDRFGQLWRIRRNHTVKKDDHL